MSSISNVSNEAVEKATGKDWERWIAFLDKQGAAGLPYKNILSLLAGKGKIASEWWCRKIATGYQQQKGMSTVGQTQDAGFQMGARKTFPLPAGKAWELLISDAGLNIWLGAPLFAAKDGGPFKAKDGVTGDITTFKPGSHLRMTWKPAKWKNTSMLQVRVLPAGQRSAISFHHDKLADARQREQMKAHWQDVLEKLAALI